MEHGFSMAGRDITNPQRIITTSDSSGRQVEDKARRFQMVSMATKGFFLRFWILLCPREHTQGKEGF
jgi:hypothetical protein